MSTSLPRPSSPWRQHEFVEELDELTNLDVEPDIILGALAKNLLIDTDAVGSLPEVVGDRRIAPSNERSSTAPEAFTTEGSSTSSGIATGRAAGPSHGLRVRAISTLYAAFAQLTRLVAADVRSTHSCAVNPTGDAQELALDWAMEAPYHVDVTGWVRESLAK